MRRVLLRSPAFVRGVKRILKRRPEAVLSLRETLLLLEADAFHPQLRSHKLKGDLKDCWSSSAGYDLRIVFEFVKHGGSEAIYLLSIGTHDEVY